MLCKRRSGGEAVLGFRGERVRHEVDLSCCCLYENLTLWNMAFQFQVKIIAPSSITLQDMREKHFAPYLEMVKAGALSLSRS